MVIGQAGFLHTGGASTEVRMIQAVDAGIALDRADGRALSHPGLCRRRRRRSAVGQSAATAAPQAGSRRPNHPERQEEAATSSPTSPIPRLSRDIARPMQRSTSATTMPPLSISSRRWAATIVADVANLIGYSWRKLGDYRLSQIWYERALNVRSEPCANLAILRPLGRSSRAIAIPRILPEPDRGDLRLGLP